MKVRIDKQTIPNGWKFESVLRNALLDRLSERAYQEEGDKDDEVYDEQMRKKDDISLFSCKVQRFEVYWKEEWKALKEVFDDELFSSSMECILQNVRTLRCAAVTIRNDSCDDSIISNTSANANERKCITGRYFDQVYQRHRQDDETIEGFEIGGKMLRIEEELNQSVGTGLNVWDGALLLAYYLQSNAASVVDGKTIVELGSGCGLVGIAAAVLGAREVILTDLSYTLPLLRGNIEYNRHVVSEKCERIECIECDWFKASSIKKFPSFGTNSSIDIILAADCVWLEELVKPFLGTLSRLCSNRECKILISYQRRGKEVHDKFISGLNRMFIASEIEFTFKWSSAIQILECSKR